MAEYIRFTQWHQHKGAKPQLQRGEILWGRNLNWQDDGGHFTVLLDAVGKAVAERTKSDGLTTARWVWDDKDKFTFVDEADLPDDIWAFICAERLLDKDADG